MYIHIMLHLHEKCIIGYKKIALRFNSYHELKVEIKLMSITINNLLQKKRSISSSS